jgi:hypothetical protein
MFPSSGENVRESRSDSLNNLSQSTAARQEVHRVGWNEIRLLQGETESWCTKYEYQELAHMTFLTNPSSEISPTWILLIKEEVSNLRRMSIGSHRLYGLFVLICMILVCGFRFSSTEDAGVGRVLYIKFDFLLHRCF